MAGGSAIPFLIDALQLVVKCSSPCAPLIGIFTCSDSGLYQFVNSAVASIIKLKPSAGIFVSLNLTHKGSNDLKELNSQTFDQIRRKNSMDQSLQGIDVSVCSTSGQPTSEGSDLPISVSKPALNMRSGSRLSNVFGRVNFTECIPNSSIVFLQGSAGMVNIATEAAKAKHCKVVKGASYDVDTNKARRAGILDKVLPFSCCGHHMRSDPPFP